MINLNDKNETSHAVVCPECRKVGIADGVDDKGTIKCRRCGLTWSTEPVSVTSPPIVGGAT